MLFGRLDLESNADPRREHRRLVVGNAQASKQHGLRPRPSLKIQPTVSLVVGVCPISVESDNEIATFSPFIVYFKSLPAGTQTSFSWYAKALPASGYRPAAPARRNAFGYPSQFLMEVARSFAIRASGLSLLFPREKPLA